MSPKISIIVTAHDRKEFLVEALSSISRQKCSPANYQVVVVKNFQDPDSDSIIEANGFTSLNCGGTLADKVLMALDYCHGEVITFLEDDDLYADTRIDRIIRIFNEYPEISFYRNSLIEIDQFGKRTGRNHHPQVKKSVFLQNSHIETILPYLVANNVDFSTGCMAIRRNVLVLNLELFRSCTSVSSKFTDSLYFFFALRSGTSVFIDSSPQTYVRRHDSMSVRVSGNLQESNAFRASFTDELIRFYRYIRKIDHLNNICSRYVSIKLARAELEYSVISGKERIMIFLEFKRFLKLAGRPHGKYEVLLSVASFVALFSSNVGRTIFNRVLGL
jgi:glycosyltransferase involved in cell wall biosynthesis